MIDFFVEPVTQLNNLVGNLDYIDRNDFQVKIRGYRMELGEIESALSSYPGVQQSVVIARDQGESDVASSENKILIGYYVSSKQSGEDSILSYLKTKLPDYMIPSKLVALESFPLNAAGKIDRKALPTPDLSNTHYVAPRNELERTVCLVYAEVLEVPADKIGIHDEFFRLGGNSISAIRLASKLNQMLDTNITVPIIFSHSQLSQLINFLKNDTEENITIEKIDFARQEDKVLSFAQERLWFIEQFEQGTNAYHIPMVFKISQSADIETLEKSFKSIIERHEVLRTLIKKNEEGYD